MASPRKLASARANGAKARGTKTPEGIRNSSLNAQRHGLIGHGLLLKSESKQVFDQLHAEYTARFQPADDVERDLVLELVATRWRQFRLWAAETNILDHEIDRQANQLSSEIPDVTEDMRLAVAFRTLADESNSLQLLNRYESRLRRSYERSLANVLLLQADRRQKQNLPNDANPGSGQSGSPHPDPAQVASPAGQTTPPRNRPSPIAPPREGGDSFPHPARDLRPRSSPMRSPCFFPPPSGV